MLTLPASPQYSPTSPQYSPTSPKYSAASPGSPYEDEEEECVLEPTTPVPASDPEPVDLSFAGGLGCLLEPIIGVSSPRFSSHALPPQFTSPALHTPEHTLLALIDTGKQCVAVTCLLFMRALELYCVVCVCSSTLWRPAHV